MTSFLVKFSSDQTDNNVLCFFCKAVETEKQETTHVLRTLLSRHLHNDNALYCDVESLYTKSRRATADSYVEVHSALILALAKTTRTTLVLVDALNSSQEAENLLQALFEAKRIAGGKVTMRSTSRQMRLPLSFATT